MKNYISCFNIIKNNIIKKNVFCYIKKTKKHYFLISVFLKMNVLLGYKITKIKNLEYYCIYLNINNNDNNNLTLLYKKSYPIFIKLKYLQKLKNKNTYTKYIISTSKGFLDYKECLKNKLGGILFIKLK